MIANLVRKEIPEDVPAGAEEIVSRLKVCGSQQECLESAYSFLAERYRGYRIRTVTRSLDLFTNNIENVWDMEGFLHCTALNYLLRFLLVKSGHFEDRDVRQKWALVWRLFPHQYLSVRMKDGGYISVDLWGTAYGVPFGDYSRGFLNTTLRRLIR